MASNQRSDPATSNLPLWPGAAHTPACGCCLAYRALKNRERVRQTMVIMQDYRASMRGMSHKSKVDNILIGLAEVCLEYEDAERVFIRAAESTAPDELKQSALRLAGEIMADAGRRLDSVNDAILEVQGITAQRATTAVPTITLTRPATQSWSSSRRDQ